MEDDNFEIDWDVDEGAKSIADAIAPLLDEELIELFEQSCDDEEHNEWLSLFRKNLNVDKNYTTNNINSTKELYFKNYGGEKKS